MILSNDIKNFYVQICEKDIAVSSIIDVFKNVAKQTFAPMVQNEKNTEVFREKRNDREEEKCL